LPFIGAPSQGNQEAMAAYALAQCKKIAPGENNYGTCLSGLFNNIGRESVAGNFGLSLVTTDPMRLCKIQTDPEAQSRCLGNYKATVISMVNVYDAASAKKNILELYGSGATTTARDAMWTIGYEWARTRLVEGETFTPTIAACAALGTPFTNYCIQGASVGLAKHGILGKQYLLMTDFCKTARIAVTTLVPEDCPSDQAVGYLRGFYSPADFTKTYSVMEQELGAVVAPPAGTYGF
jgi:hypothetical protein